MVRRGNPARPRPCTGRIWRRLQEIVFATYTHCILCGEYVDQTLTEGPRQRSVEHVIPQALRPDLALVLANLRLAHLGCNSARGKRPVVRGGRASRSW